MRISALCIPVLLLSACAELPPVAEAPKPKKLLPAPKPKEVVREPGSLWSEDSRWNDIYSSAPTRAVGDSITVKVGGDLRDKMTTVSKPVQVAVQTKEEGPKDTTSAEVAQGSREKTFEASIHEVLPKGVFKVTAVEPVENGKGYLVVNARVRERDIASDDTVPSEALIGTSVELQTDQEKK